MNVGSLFSGIGGIELGFEREGFNTAWFVENEPYYQAVLRKHWPETPIYGDIKEIDFAKLPKVDILTGGFPCQDISNAGTRAGITGKRSGLWKEYLRAISEIRPKYAVVENVSALTFRGLLVVLRDLAEVGYDAEWNCIPASAFGAPHRRDRIYIAAYPTSQRLYNQENEQELESKRSRKFLFEQSRNTENVAYSEDTWASWGKRFKGNDASQGFEGRNIGGGSNQDYGCKNVADCSGNRREQSPNRELGAGSQEMAHSYGEEFSGSIKASIGKGQSEAKVGGGSNFVSYSDYYYYYWQQCKARFREKNRRTTWATDAGILRVAHGIPNRVHRIKALGNAVVPQVAQFIAKIIKEKEGIV